MYEPLQKKENKSRAVANVASQKKSDGKQGFGFVDNRPEAITQKKLQEAVDNRTQLKQSAQLQVMAENHSGREQQPIQKKENKTGLPDNLKAGIENISGYSMDDVKVHRNSDKPAQLQAHAYAQGTDIHIGPGQEKHLPHEAWHVVQQKQGKVKSTTQLKEKVNGNRGLEREADVMGAKALSVDGAYAQLSQLKQTIFPGEITQCILQDAANGTLVSTSDKTTIIDANNAAITVAATKDEATGGHAEIYLELLENGTPVEYSLDMFGANEGRVVVRMKRYAMGEMNSRRKGGSTTHAITTAQADQALVAATQLKIDAQSETLKYTYYVPKMWNMNLMSSITYMNCADFSAAVLNAAGIAGSSSGMLSMPKTVANE